MPAPIALHPPTVTHSNPIGSGSGGQVTTAKLRADFNGYTMLCLTGGAAAVLAVAPDGLPLVEAQGVVTAAGP